MIGIIGAMPIEIEGIKNLMVDVQEEKTSYMNFYSGKLNGIECVVALCSAGKVNAAMCTQIMICKYKTNVILNIGVAGALKDNIKIGDIVIADYVVQHDMDTSAIRDDKGFISGLNMIKIPCTKAINDKILNIASELNEHVHVGIIATGDQFISCNKKLCNIRDMFDASACEMEAGSIGHVCYTNGVDFAAIRVISDNANSNSHIDYQKFKFVAAEKSTELVFKLIACI